MWKSVLISNAAFSPFSMKNKHPSVIRVVPGGISQLLGPLHEHNPSGQLGHVMFRFLSHGSQGGGVFLTSEV